MSTGTSPLPTARAQMDALRQAANEATIANLAPTVARMQAEKIAELEDKLARCNAHLSNCQDTGNLAGMVNDELKAQVAALRERLNFLLELLEQIRNADPGMEEMIQWQAALAAGYLSTGEGVSS